MRFHQLLVLAATAAITVAVPEAPAARPVADSPICTARGDAVAGTVKLIRASALERHLAKGDCRVTVAALSGDACDRHDADGDDVCDYTCGDTAGSGGSDLPCFCGSTVLSDTVLAASDPVANAACRSHGLILGAGVRLDLGTMALTGSDQGDGLSLQAGGTVVGGTVGGFATGLRTTGSASVDGTTIEGNTGAGVVVDVANTTGRVVLRAVTVQGNGGDGIHVRAAPGASNLDDAGQRLALADYGVVIGGTFGGIETVVQSNLGHGIHLGDPAQPADVAAMVEGVALHGNAGAGLLLEQASGLAPGADCGASGGQPGCSGATIANNEIRDNAGPGVRLRGGTILPLLTGGTDHGLGFVANLVFHNAMGPGCTSAQAFPQILVDGPVVLGDAACAAATTEAACSDANTPVNQHCTWTGIQCTVAWDLRGGGAECNNALRNSIFGYNTSDTSAVTVGLRAEGTAVVSADGNEWASSTSSQNITQGGDAFVRADFTCGTRGCPVP